LSVAPSAIPSEAAFVFNSSAVTDSGFALAAISWGLLKSSDLLNSKLYPVMPSAAFHEKDTFATVFKSTEALSAGALNSIVGIVFSESSSPHVQKVMPAKAARIK